MKKAYSVYLIFLLLLSCGRTENKVDTLINISASRIDSISFNPLKWKVVTSSTNHAKNTQSILYGNDIAVDYARSNAAKQYPPGSKLCFVTWSQQNDKHWFGAKIPYEIISIELITFKNMSNGSFLRSYEKYIGKPLQRLNELDSTFTAQRINYIISQDASVLP
ncbi:MAG: hypothetical protein EKK39_11210 [Sphingobacteriales bacterium]|uniref:hypothetical protein n=1 Tax=Hydrotalea flava TaxID=714549 RepID=UPI00082FF533|nr:hypothetical protein [Hydrotalea flava]RTL49302.1 MAG: hypothetical protein EKK39_11210 [Sphingobacteriales bacterium]